MENCCLNNEDNNCDNIQLLYSHKKNNFFWGCSSYPKCNYARRTEFDPNKLTLDQTKLMNAFDCFVNLNSFLMVTFATVYFNLQDPVFLDYMLRTEIIKDYKSEVEIGKSGAKIFYDLYFHLMLIPNKHIRNYLKNNFPKNCQIFEEGKKPIIFRDVDYYKNSVNEQAFLPYKDAYLNY